MWERAKFSTSHISSFLVGNGVAIRTLSDHILSAVLGLSEGDYRPFPPGSSVNLQLVEGVGTE